MTASLAEMLLLPPQPTIDDVTALTDIQPEQLAATAPRTHTLHTPGLTVQLYTPSPAWPFEASFHQRPRFPAGVRLLCLSLADTW